MKQHRAEMAPHQLTRREGKLFCDAIKEIERLNEEVADWKMELAISTDRLRGKKHPNDNGIMGDGEVDVVRLLKIETAARQWWKAKGRHNSQIAACKVGEALGHPVTWPAGYIPANGKDDQR